MLILEFLLPLTIMLSSSSLRKSFGHVFSVSTLVLLYRFIAGNPTQPPSSRRLANFERMIQITLEEKIEAFRSCRPFFKVVF